MSDNGSEMKRLPMKVLCRRYLFMLLAVVLLLNLLGCARERGDPVNNEVFTDEFFQDVVEIRFGISNEPITGQQLAAVARYLKSLHLTHSEKELPYEREPGHYGGWDIVQMEFAKRDGTSLRIRLNQWAMSGLPGGSYYVTDGKDAIERGDKSILRSLWEACGRDPEAYPFFD